MGVNCCNPCLFLDRDNFSKKKTTKEITCTVCTNQARALKFCFFARKFKKFFMKAFDTDRRTGAKNWEF